MKRRSLRAKESFGNVGDTVSVATARLGPLTARLRALGHIFGDGPGADQTTYGLEAAVSRPEPPKPFFDCLFG
jgi:hypothetical protein